MNKSIGLIFAVFVALAVSYAFSPRKGPPMPATEISLNNALLLDTQRASQRLVAVGERGYIFVSDDDGAVWRRVPSGVESTLTAVAFADKLGVAVGHDAAIVRSEDGGLSWKAVFSAPERLPASTTTVPVASAAMSRFRLRKRRRCGAAPGGLSLITRPVSATRSRWPSSGWLRPSALCTT